MARGKWIPDLKAETPLADAARLVLALRLEVVRDYLPLAVHQSDEDPEHVHQLRVGTRRAGAALEIFAACLPAKVHKRARKFLRRIRRAAGAARDWDVFLLNLQADTEQRGVTERPGLEFLFGYGLGQRVAAQAHLEAVGTSHPFRFEQVLAETVAAVRDPANDGGLRTLLDLARPLLLDLLKELDQAMTADLSDFEHLHRVRIIGKRLRYAMEVFGTCFSQPFQERLYPAVEEMQEILGRANDSHVAAERLKGLRDRLRKCWPAQWKVVKAGIEGQIRMHQRRLPQERRRFLKWWQRWQDAGSEATFTGLLRTPASIGP